MVAISTPPNEDRHILIVGAGVSGINTAYRVQTELPGWTYDILEGRGAIGGTWDLFKYPGIRSDSDLHTFGFKWQPWPNAQPIAEGPLIKSYVNDCARKFGIDKKVKFHHKVVAYNWSSKEQLWTVTVEANGQTQIMRARFLFLSTGYYSYDQPLEAKIAGLENFKGKVIHPQFWPENFDYTGKKIVIVGSGATAITLLPNLAKKAKYVTMLQRTPTYIMNLPNQRGSWLRAILPTWLGYKLSRWQFLLLPYIFFRFCRAYPKVAKAILQRGATRQLPAHVPVKPHFDPPYNPWEQRLCVCPDGDFYTSIREGKATVATGTIKTVTENSVVLNSGQTISADVIITATGLKIQLAGGAKTSVDGLDVQINSKFLWRGCMLQDIPNMVFIIGYTNASWTLGADASARLSCRLIKQMEAERSTNATPRVPAGTEMKKSPMLNISSTYIVKAVNAMPVAGDSGPWKARDNYFVDNFNASWASVTDGIQYGSIKNV
jgi:cation diffusion facilitator CzcD-associated flavoprotein CzcO